METKKIKIENITLNTEQLVADAGVSIIACLLNSDLLDDLPSIDLELLGNIILYRKTIPAIAKERKMEPARVVVDFIQQIDRLGYSALQMAYELSKIRNNTFEEKELLAENKFLKGIIASNNFTLEVDDEQKLLHLSSISNLGLDARITNALKSSDISTIGHLLRTSQSDLMKMPKLGPKTINEILKAMHKMNLSFMVKN